MSAFVHHAGVIKEPEMIFVKDAGIYKPVARKFEPAADWFALASVFGTSRINRIRFGGGAWVAVGQAGKLATSTNGGATWTLRDAGFGTSEIFDVDFGLNRWVAVGESGKLSVGLSSLVTWTLQDAGFGASAIRGIRFEGGDWVAVGDEGKIASGTTNASSWTQRSSPFEGSRINAVSSGPGTTNSAAFACVGVGGKLATSTNGGATWTLRDSGVTAELKDVSYSDLGWIAVGSSGTVISARTYSALWESLPSPANLNLNCVEEISGLILVGTSGGRVYVSQVLGPWQLRDTGFNGPAVNGIAQGAGRLIAVGGSGQMAANDLWG